jgi:hypothetical protein
LKFVFYTPNSGSSGDPHLVIELAARPHRYLKPETL